MRTAGKRAFCRPRDSCSGPAPEATEIIELVARYVKPCPVQSLRRVAFDVCEVVVWLCSSRIAEIIRQKQPFHGWRRQKKISSVEYLSTLPSEIFVFLASREKSYFLGFFWH
ncbi:MAG: hypothetical protein HDQ90_07560 [Desulfovibrio sp.]|nr:hypothetical protein [Desulfovibrio sp.]